MESKTRILIIGASGYIGGTILTEFLAQRDAYEFRLSALVRQEKQAEKLKQAGVNAILFKGLDDVDAILEAAETHDVIIAAASARHVECAKACITGLEQRMRITKRATHYIHASITSNSQLLKMTSIEQTSGTSMLNDWPVTRERLDESFHSDVDEDIYTQEKNHPESYSAVRKVNQVVVQAGEAAGVKTYIVPPPLIFGKGSGMFNISSGQVEMMAELSFKHKQAVVIGEGKGIWNRVHVVDLAKLYFLLAQAILASKLDLPSGRIGYYFAENGYQTWLSISEGIGKAAKAQGAFSTDEVKSISLHEAAEVFFGGNTREAESVLASNSRTRADRARQVLGWQPKYGHEDFLNDIEEIVAEESGRAQGKGS